MKCPVTIVTGFLGSGKTTLLAKVLQHDQLKNSAIIVNEYGKVGLDHHLLRQIDENTKLIGGGCLCCSVREDLVKELRDLLNSKHRGDHSPIARVIVETSGLADPAPILFTILNDPLLQHHFYVDRIVTTVDARNAKLHRELHAETTKQLIIADKIILTKIDLITQEEQEELIYQLHLLNPTAQIIPSLYGDVDVTEVFLTKIGKSKPLQITREREQITHPTPTSTISFTFDQPLNWSSFGIWLSMLLHVHGEKILRVKGLLDVGMSGPIVLNGVQHIIHPPEHLETWPEKMEKRSDIVFIMQSINPGTVLQSLMAFQTILNANVKLLESVQIT